MYNPDIHHRRSIRLKEYDYASVGAYYVTICTQNRKILFGDIHDGEMTSNEVGRMMAEMWLELPDRFIGISLDEFIIMPNHFHGIIVIKDLGSVAVNSYGCLGDPDSVGTLLAAPAFDVQKCNNGDVIAENKGAAIAENKGAASSAPTLGKIMRAFKSLSSIEVNRLLERQGQPLWQRNYYERVIRNDYELAGIREYIHFNPANWVDDEENAKP